MWLHVRIPRMKRELLRLIERLEAVARLQRQSRKASKLECLAALEVEERLSAWKQETESNFPHENPALVAS